MFFRSKSVNRGCSLSSVETCKVGRSSLIIFAFSSVLKCSNHFGIIAFLRLYAWDVTVTMSDHAAKAKGQRTKAFLRVLKYSGGGILEVTSKSHKSLMTQLVTYIDRINGIRLIELMEFVVQVSGNFAFMIHTS